MVDRMVVQRMCSYGSPLAERYSLGGTKWTIADSTAAIVACTVAGNFCTAAADLSLYVDMQCSDSCQVSE